MQADVLYEKLRLIWYTNLPYLLHVIENVASFKLTDWSDREREGLELEELVANTGMVAGSIKVLVS